MLLTLVLVACAAAEWVEISQQHYRKPVRITTTIDTTRNTHVLQNSMKKTYQDIHNPVRKNDQMRNTYLDQHVLQTPMRDFHLRNPVSKYQEHDLQDSVNVTYPNREVSLKKTIREHFYNHSEAFPKPVRLNPFLQEDIYTQSPVRNTKINKVPSPTSFIENVGNTVEDAYVNRSITEHNWDQNIHRGNEKFVTTVSSFDSWNDNPQKANEKGKLKVDKNIPNTVRVQDETVSGKIERVPNIGSVKRVQLANTPVKSPVLNNKFPTSTNKRVHNYDGDELNLEASIFNAQSISKKPLNNFKQEQSGTKEVQIDYVNHENPNSSLVSFQRHPFTHNPDDVSDKLTKVIKDSVKLTQNGHVLENAESSGHKDINQISAVNNRSATKVLEEFSDNDHILPDFVTKNEKLIESSKKVEPNVDTGESMDHVKIKKIDSAEEESSSEKNENINKSSSEIKVNTMENILKFIKVVADTISKNTKRGALGKITYLNELKHTLMANIKDRIDAAWPDDETSAGTRRRSRSASAAATARGHVEFPSSESALMTISFLTFAVFLIKLVLQVIQTYKHKTMVMAPLMVATAGRTATKMLRDNSKHK